MRAKCFFHLKTDFHLLHSRFSIKRFDRLVIIIYHLLLHFLEADQKPFLEVKNCLQVNSRECWLYCELVLLVTPLGQSNETASMIHLITDDTQFGYQVRFQALNTWKYPASVVQMSNQRQLSFREAKNKLKKDFGDCFKSSGRVLFFLHCGK